MKRTSILVGALLFAAVARAQPIPLSELVGANNSLKDSMYGISLTYPAGWEVRGAHRWGKNNRENTIMFQALWPLEARPSLYYQPTSNFDKPAKGEEEAHFKRTAGTKAQQRIASGMKDYQNLDDTFVFTTINGRPAFRYTARFTMRGRPHFEYFVRVLGDEMMAMFFVVASAEEIEAIRRDIDQMAATIRVP